LSYVGVAIPVGRLQAPVMRALAAIAQTYGSGTLCTTVWQNVIVPDISDGFVDAACDAIVAAGLQPKAGAIAGGVIACTGNTGCKFSATNTKGHARELLAHLDARVRLDEPVNIHFTGCPNSCAQHYVGDIGLLGVNVTVDGRSVEAYNIVVGGGTDDRAALGRDLFAGIPATRMPALIEHMLSTYERSRIGSESFTTFVRRHEIDDLRSLFEMGTRW
jgi:ferredoxin-nitrite reductase